MKLIQYSILGLLSFFYTSCVGVYLRDNTYEASTKPVDINGAQVKIAVKPMGGKGYGSLSALVIAIGAGSTDGPFIWRVEGEGQDFV